MASPIFTKSGAMVSTLPSDVVRVDFERNIVQTQRGKGVAQHQSSGFGSIALPALGNFACTMSHRNVPIVTENLVDGTINTLFWFVLPWLDC